MMKKQYRLLITTTLLTSLSLLTLPIALADKNHNEQHHGAHHQNSHKHDTHNQKKKHTHKEAAAHQHDVHGHHDVKPRHGGTVSIVDNHHHELVINNNKRILLYVEGLPKNEAFKDIQIELVVLQGTKKQRLQMKPANNEHYYFEVSLEKKLKPNYKIVAIIKQKDEKTRLVRFE